METKNIKTDELVDTPESAAIALILSQVEGVVLFPEQIENAKKYLKQINEEAAI
jgi:hypothetical protein